MSRPIRAMILLLLVSACGSGNYEAPRNLDNACSIVKQRPHYLDAMQQTEIRWGVPIAVQMATIYQESKFIGNARTPRKKSIGIFPGERISTAYGYGQALDGTWEEYQEEHGGWRARRDNIHHATDFMGWYFNKSQAGLGIPLDDAKHQYLAYHEGRTGYARGSYLRKAWLMRVSDEVASRAIMYDAQLKTCGYV